MSKRDRLAAAFLLVSLLLLFACVSPSAAPAPTPAAPATLPSPAATPAPTPVPRIKYPAAPIEPHVETIHGREMDDPFFRLENGADPQTVAWTSAQEELTRRLLDRPERRILEERLTRLYDFPKLSTPVRRHGRYFFSRRDGRQDQPVWYVQDGPAAARRVLLDPNTLSQDGTAAVDLLAPSRNGRLAGYAISRSGSDRQEIFVRDVETGKDLRDRLRWVKFTGIAWSPDSRGFYYTRYPEPGTVPAGDENYFPKICYHAIGDPQSRDRVVYERPREKEVGLSVDVSWDGRWLILVPWQTTNRSEVWVLDRQRAGARPRPIAQGFDSSWLPIEIVDGRLYMRTDRDAPLGRVVRVDLRRLPTKGPVSFETVVPEGPDVLENAAVAGGQLLLQRLRMAHSVLSISALDGKDPREISLPDLGTINDLNGAPDEDEALFSWVSFTQPSTPYRLGVRGATVQAFETPAAAPEAADLVTEQVFYPVKGSKVSMFLVHRRGLPKDGNRPVYLYGYGGFAVNMTPAYSVGGLLLASADGILAIPNLRGGGEYGEEWHRAGMREGRQNVYDDFLAAADWLVAEGWTKPARLAIGGGSNGGLLTAWCLLRKPKQFGAVISQVPVTDLLRFHKFTVGRYWIGEYGNPDDPNDWVFLFRFSPYHQIRDGRVFPPTLITTADTDDRVDPAHARKFAARLQAAQDGPAPILLRVETRAGHGHGKPLSKTIAESADIWTFLFWQLGVSTDATVN